MYFLGTINSSPSISDANHAGHTTCRHYPGNVDFALSFPGAPTNTPTYSTGIQYQHTVPTDASGRVTVLLPCATLSSTSLDTVGVVVMSVSFVSFDSISCVKQLHHVVSWRKVSRLVQRGVTSHNKLYCDSRRNGL